MYELDKEQRRLLKREADVGRLNALQQQAVHSGIKLGQRDRLKAAFHLTRAWRQAKREGLRREDFQDAVYARLQRAHSNRREFRLDNWTLRRGEDPSTQDLMKKYEKKNTPQKALEPYLVGIAVAAEHCGVDPADWQMDMTRDLAIWPHAPADPNVAPLDERPAETLAILLNSLCAELGSRNALAETFEVIDRMSCRWEMFEEQLVACEGLYMERLRFMSPPINEGNDIDGMFPFPSVPLLRVPYAVGNMQFDLAPDALLRPLDDGDENRRYKGVTQTPPEIFPENAPGLQRADGNLFFYREIGLAIVPDGRGGFAGNLESRPYMEVQFDEIHPFAGRHQVMNGHIVDLDDFFFSVTEFDGKYRFPTISAHDGTVWRLNFAAHPPGRPPTYQLVTQNPETTGWMFDKDPVRQPGETEFSTEYICFTPIAAADVRHWFMQDWRLLAPWDGTTNEWAACPWFSAVATQKALPRKTPPIYELNFPDRSHATFIESSLHDGSIKTALQTKIDSLQKQTARLQSEWNDARERHSNALLRRWKSGS